jgi:hypothetical protein
MKRRGFLGRLLGLAALPVVVEALPHQDAAVFDKEKINAQADRIKQYPLTERECFRTGDIVMGYDPVTKHGSMGLVISTYPLTVRSVQRDNFNWNTENLEMASYAHAVAESTWKPRK